MVSDLKTPDDILRAIKDDKIQSIDLRYTDLAGRWQHFLLRASAFDLKSFEGVVGFDGHAMRPLQPSDMRVIPDPACAFRDPFAEMPMLVVICNLRDPATGQNDTRDPRAIAQKAEAYLQATQIGDVANFGLELEHFIFERQPEDQSAGNDHRERNMPAAKSSARRFPVPPPDLLLDISAQVIATMKKIGIEAEAHHRKAASNGQDEIDMHYAALTRMADSVMIYKYVVQNVARRRGMMATFVPKPLFSDGGSGMNVHQSIWHAGRPLFAGDGYASTSALMRHYLAGLVEHAPALLAVCAPTANLSRSSVPRFEVPMNLGYAERTHSAACRVPMNSSEPAAKRVEFRCPDPSCNPYVAFAAMLMAGIDGFDNRLYNCDPADPIEMFYEQRPQKQRAERPSAPAWLEESRAALEADHDFLLRGGVFTPDVIASYVGDKRSS